MHNQQQVYLDKLTYFVANKHDCMVNMSYKIYALYLYTTVVCHGYIEDTVAYVSSHIQTQVIEAQANYAASRPVLVNLWVICHTPTYKVRPA